jgi:hypothetical protein
MIARRLRTLRSRRNEIGASAVIFAMFFTVVMIPISAISVDVSRMYVEIQRVQAAADAAATAGVTYMPDDFDAAKDRAIEVSARNGFPHSGTSRVVVTAGDKPTQLMVTVSSTVQNSFGGFFGVDTATVTRSALADFNGPAPMGSPCNTFGNEPAGSSSKGPTGSVLKTPPYANCSSKPEFWGAIAGPETWKDQGSEFEARKCGGGEDGCASGANGAANEQFDPRGFIYMIRVNQAGVGHTINLQAYDPAYVDTGSTCNTGPTATGLSSGDNHRYPLATTDAHQRYARGANSFCTGDSDNNGRRFGGEVGTITSFAVREPVDTLNPYAAPLLSTSCIKQFPGYPHTGSGSTNLSTNNLRNSGSGASYNQNLAKVFHQWVDICSFTPDRAGDWYVQVRNNVSLSTTTVGADGAVTGNTRVITQAGDDLTVKGNGTNQFGLRAQSSAPAGAVSVASWERMRIFANADSANTVFNLVRVVPAAANKTLLFTFFDVGEASSNGTVTVLPPTDSNLGTTVNGCQGTGVRNGALSGCAVTGVNSDNFNGKLQTVRVPIPNTYTCESSSQGGCWFRVRVNFGSGSVTDATTWTARIVGEPVRLIE